MPIYVYVHDEAPPGEPGVPPVAPCPEPFERIEPLSAPARAACPACGRPVHRVPAGFAYRKNVLAASNLKEKGFTRLTRRDRGAYEAD